MKRTGKDYDNISDILEYANITDNEAIAICNEIIDESITESENQILEAMYHAIFTGVVNRKIADQLHIDIIIKSLDKFNEDVLDYIITILAFTGNREYEGIIRQIGQQYGNLDIENALSELENIAVGNFHRK